MTQPNDEIDLEGYLWIEYDDDGEGHIRGIDTARETIQRLIVEARVDELKHLRNPDPDLDIQYVDDDGRTLSILNRLTNLQASLNTKQHQYRGDGFTHHEEDDCNTNKEEQSNG